MPIQLDCPRCKHRLSVASRKAGDYATCPRCKGRFFVPEVKDMAQPPSAVREPPQMAQPPAAQPSVAQPPVPPVVAPSGGLAGRGVSGFQPPVVSAARPTAPAGNAARMILPATPPQGVARAASPPAPPPAIAPRKVARLVTTETAQSTLKLADDGKLPELQLREPGEDAVRPARSRGMNPLLLFGLLALSMVASVLLVLAPTGGQAPTTLRDKQEARRIIREEYFGGDSGAGPESYQHLLREAYQAHDRRDYKRERERYQQVLKLLRAERRTSDQPLTGSPASDRKLRDQIETILRD